MKQNAAFCNYRSREPLCPPKNYVVAASSANDHNNIITALGVRTNEGKACTDTLRLRDGDGSAGKLQDTVKSHWIRKCEWTS